MPRPSSNSLTRKIKYRAPKKVIVIATEDSVTGGYAYFEYLKTTNFFENFVFNIKVSASSEGKSAPQHILANIKNEKKHKGGDSFWIVCDVDYWKKERIEKVTNECSKIKVGYAFSNPCFEIWTLYHKNNIDSLPEFPNSQSCKDEANALLSGRTGGLKGLVTTQQIECAIRHSEGSHRSKKDQWPKTQGTHLYKLFKILLNQQ